MEELCRRALSLVPGVVPRQSFWRQQLSDVLCTLNWPDATPEFFSLVDDVLKIEKLNAEEREVDETTIPAINATWNNICVWRGDITTLRCDAIVNAANDQMLGCFKIGHKCIDNVIHAKAGPRLRHACRDVRERPEPSGSCKITPGFMLPSRFVLHTVGPYFYDSMPYEPQAAVLRSSYRSCLDVAAKNGLKSVAFCCISTGVFCFPQREAAQEAMSEVKRWLLENESSSIERVIFNTFTETDTEIYRELAPQFFPPYNEVHANHLRLLLKQQTTTSKFNQDLFARALKDLRRGPDSIWNRYAATSTDPNGDVFALRILGCLNYAAITRRDEELHQLWPSLQNVNGWDADKCWRAGHRFLTQNEAFVSDFIKSPPQTNEIRRSAAIVAGISYALDEMPHLQRRVRLLELGASAGLNSLLDCYRFECNEFSFGSERADAIRIRFDWLVREGAQAPRNGFSAFRVLSRAAVDMNPLDVQDEETARRLQAYCWPDQTERVERLLKAIQFARQEGLHVDKGDALAWLQQKLQNFPDTNNGSDDDNYLTVIFHSAFLLYPPADVRKGIHDAIFAAGQRATANRPLLWLRLEMQHTVDEFAGELIGADPQVRNVYNFFLDLITFPGGKRRVLAKVGAHGQPVEWVEGAKIVK